MKRWLNSRAAAWCYIAIGLLLLSWMLSLAAPPGKRVYDERETGPGCGALDRFSC